MISTFSGGGAGRMSCKVQWSSINIQVVKGKSRDAPARIVATLRRMNIAVKAQRFKTGLPECTASRRTPLSRGS